MGNNLNIVAALKKNIAFNEGEINFLQQENNKFKDVLNILSGGKRGRPAGRRKSSKQGFAAMSVAQRKRIASMGGRASQVKIKKLLSKVK